MFHKSNGRLQYGTLPSPFWSYRVIIGMEEYSYLWPVGNNKNVLRLRIKVRRTRRPARNVTPLEGDLTSPTSPPSPSDASPCRRTCRSFIVATAPCSAS